MGKQKNKLNPERQRRFSTACRPADHRGVGR